PSSAADFGHTLDHALTERLRADRLAAALRRHGETPTDKNPPTMTPRLESRWRTQLALRRRWFDSQRQEGPGSPPANAARRAQGLILLADADENDHNGCAHHLSLKEARTHRGGCSHSHHQNPRGLLMVDLDEAAHGVYASVKQGLPIFKGEGLGAMREEFAEQTKQLENDPVGWMAHEVPPEGVADFSAALGTSALVAPLALIALKAGIHETRDANHIRHELNARQSLLEADVARLSVIAAEKSEAPNLAGAMLKVSRQAAQDNRFAARINRLRMGIGLSSAASGLTIFLKSISDIALKVGLVASAKKFNVAQFVAEHGVAAAAVSAAGVAGTLVLGPLAGIFATALGGFFARKSALRHRAFREDRKRVNGFLNTAKEHLSAAGKLNTAVTHYKTFIDRKLTERARFYRLFKRWNFSFLGGSSIYAASALTKAGLAIAALAGAGALISNPVGWGILLGVSVAGAVIMGLSSWQFLFGHPKNERYERYFRDDNQDLDRHFLALADLLPALESQGPWSALQLRAALFESLEQRHDALEKFIQKVASQQGKKPRMRPVDIGRNIIGKLAASASGAASLLRSGSVRAAKHAASQTWDAQAAHLTAGTLKSWLGTEDAKRTWSAFCQQHLEAQRAYLEKKLAYRLHIYEQHSAAAQTPAAEETKNLQALAEFFSELDQGIERDQALLERIRLCLDTHPEGIAPDQLMLALLSGVKPDSLDSLPADALRKELATTLLNDLPRRLRDTKGMLLETEMQAARVRAQSQPPTANQ
ncbi:MAG: hypothetical protein RIR70_2161, partial [Pseudomonadota bacterium]